MLEMRTVLKKIKPEENCYRYYEMSLYPKDQVYHVELKWGRLHGSLVPKWVKKKAVVFNDSNEALKVVMKKLKEKQGRGYLVG
mgnify:CR=1 FL=1